MTTLLAMLLAGTAAAGAPDTRDAPASFTLRPHVEGTRRAAIDLFRPPRLSTSSAPSVRKAQELMDRGLNEEAIVVLEREHLRQPGSADVLLNLGWASWHVGRAERAQRAWKLLYQLDPHNALFVRLYAAIEVDVGRPESGEALAREALELAPGDVDASLVLCKALVALAGLPEAQAVAEGLLRDHPRRPAVLYQAGEIYDLQRSFELSLPLYDLLVELDAQEPRYGRRRAEALYELDRFEEAVREWRRLIAFDPPDGPSLRALGRVYFAVQAYDEAWHYWLRLAARSPKDPNVLFLVASVQIERGRFEDALRIGRRILQLAPEDADGHVALAKALARLGRTAQARDLLAGYIRRHPDGLSARFQMADVLYQMGLYAEALEQYEALLRRKPGVPAYRRLRAQALFSLGRHAEAIREWRELAGAEPPDVLSLYNLAWGLAALGRHEEAIDAAWRLVRLEPRRPDGFVLMSGLELERNRPEAAAEAARRGLEREPQSRDATLALARAELAMGDAASARARLRELLPKNRYHLPVLFELARVELADGRPEDALPLFERLGTLAPASVLYRRKRAEALYELGRCDEATTIWRALAAAPVPDLPSLERLIADAVVREDWGEAESLFDRLRATAALDASRWERLGRIRLFGGRPVEALEAVEQAVRVDTAAFSPHLLRADALETLARHPEAESLQETFLKRNPSAERPWLALARLAQARGDPAAALERLREGAAKLGWPQLGLREARVLADLGRSAEAVRRVRALAASPSYGVTVLSYPGLARFERGEGVPVKAFRSHLAALRAAGYRPVGLADVLAAAAGTRALPPRAVLITVDDPRARALAEADAALAETGWKAALFAPGVKPRPAYPSAQELGRLTRSGRWELGSLGVAAAEPAALDAAGRHGRFFGDRLWSKALGRRESEADFAARVEREYRAARRALDAGRPAAFAFPGGEFGQGEASNHPGAAPLNQKAVFRHFDLAFSEDPWGYNRGLARGKLLRRLAVPRDWSGARLVSHLMTNDPRIQARMLEANIYLAEGKLQRALRLYESLEGEGVLTGELFAQKGVAYERMGFLWRASREYARAVELEPDNARYRELYAAAMMAIGPKVEPAMTTFADNQDRTQSRGLLRFGSNVQETRITGWGGLGRYLEGTTPGVDAREMGASVRFPFGYRGWGELRYVRRSYSLADSMFDGSGTLRRRGRVRDGSDLGADAAFSLLPQLQAEIGFASQDVDSARAIVEGRTVRSGRLGLGWDVGFNWTANVSGEARSYSDGNDERAARFALARRLAERVTAGYAYTRSTAETDSPLYYSPRSLQKHMLTVTARPGTRTLRGLLQAGAGYGIQDTGSRMVQALRGGLEWRIRDRFLWTIQAGYTQSPTYTTRDLATGLTIGF
ncbi:MAG: tetratricopeptide repeat protein [Elusimicrobia bacterium]|nr:tetratricopeptide repeat protein [Elusimicrobiota bacterium]